MCVLRVSGLNEPKLLLTPAIQQSVVRGVGHPFRFERPDSSGVDDTQLNNALG
jgi:hypothetical protein